MCVCVCVKTTKSGSQDYNKNQTKHLCILYWNVYPASAGVDKSSPICCFYLDHGRSRGKWGVGLDNLTLLHLLDLLTIFE